MHAGTPIHEDVGVGEQVRVQQKGKSPNGPYSKHELAENDDWQGSSCARISPTTAASFHPYFVLA
jgi:hypothetical protein